MKTKSLILFIFLSLCANVSYSDIEPEKFNESNELIRIGNYKNAKNLLRKILKENPDNIQIINNLAYIEAKTGNIDQAILMLRNSISKNKNIDIVYKNLTNLYAYQANILYEEALSLQESDKKDINLLLSENLNIQNNNKEITTNNLTEKTSKIQNQNYISKEDVKIFLENWAIFWEEKNFEDYFNSYAENYYSKKFKNNESWKLDRQRKIKNKSNINIKISDINILISNNINAVVQFTQSYNSDSFSDVVKKHATISRIDNSFKITGEFILK